MLKREFYISQNSCRFRFNWRLYSSCLMISLIVVGLVFFGGHGQVELSLVSGLGFQPGVEPEVDTVLVQQESEVVEQELESSLKVAGQDLSKFDFLFYNKSAADILKEKEVAERIAQQQAPARKGLFYDLAQLRKKVAQEFGDRENLVKSQTPEKEFRLMLYRKDLVRHLKVSTRIALKSASKESQQLFEMVGSKIKYFLEIKNDGSIKNLFLMTQTGVEDFDNFLLSAVRSAVPFPPVPKYLNVESLVVFD